MTTPQKTPTGLEKFSAKWPLYVRVGFGAVVLFGMVGNCAGHREGSVAIFILTAILWSCTRIVQEAIDAIRILKAVREFESANSEKKDPPAPPADPTA